MKLYYTPGACSLAPHIAAREAGLALELEKVDLAKKTTDTGADYLSVNPKGYVPALRLDNGEILTEAAAVLQYLADQAPHGRLAPPQGTFERYRFVEWLTFISSELHKGFGPLWKPDTPEATRKTAIARLNERFAFLNEHFRKNSFLMGETFTAADAYLFTVLNWANFHKLDLAPFENVRAFLQRVFARPSVQEALKAEGLLRETT